VILTLLDAAQLIGSAESVMLTWFKFPDPDLKPNSSSVEEMKSKRKARSDAFRERQNGPQSVATRYSKRMEAAGIEPASFVNNPRSKRKVRQATHSGTYPRKAPLTLLVVDD
jgi:hypothetical protein